MIRKASKNQPAPLGLTAITTASALEAMPDPSAFERLALACLRHLASEECAALIHLGINAEGKSANSRLDAFTRVPWSTPALFVGAAFTTEKKANLWVKWLGTPATPRRRRRPKSANTQLRRNPSKSPLEADLPKALGVAADLQAKFPDARFKLFLVTNRSVSEDLQTAVHQAAAANSAVTVEFVEQTRLRDFLDHEREGQFLRQEFLGIPATRVSRSLLAACGRRMIEDRKRLPDLAEACHLISRPVKELVRTACASTRHALVWLVAEPGKGKTLAAIAELERHEKAGGVARLSDASNAQREASILLAGFLGLPECGAFLAETWQAATIEQRQGWVGAYLWATTRCLGDRAKAAWESGLETWLTLSPDAATPHASSPRWHVAGGELGRIHTPWLPDGLATWLATLIHAGHPLHTELSAVLRAADTPAAVEFVVRQQGERRRADPKNPGLGFWLSLRRPARHGEKMKLSTTSLARLHAIWSANHEPKDDREAALAFWCAATDGADLHQLFGLSPDSFLQPTSLFHRMKLRDATCVPMVIKHLTDRPHWLRMLPSVWTRYLRHAVDQLLSDHDSSILPHDLYELFIAIPPVDAESLILAHAPKLRSMPEILQAAVLAGTPRLHAWVRDVAPDSAELRAKIFDHVEMRIGTTRHHRLSFATPKRWLYNLEPFLDWLPVKELENFMRDWHPTLPREWAQLHVLPRLPEELRAQHTRSAKSLLAHTTDSSGKDLPAGMTEYFLERSRRLGWPDAEMLDAVQEWAEQRRDDFSFTWLASCIAHAGTRADLSRLEVLLSLRATDNLQRVLVDTNFSVRRRLLL